MDIYITRRDQTSEISSKSLRMGNGFLSQSKNISDLDRFYNLLGQSSSHQPYSFRHCNLRYQIIELHHDLKDHTKFLNKMVTFYVFPSLSRQLQWASNHQMAMRASSTEDHGPYKRFIRDMIFEKEGKPMTSRLLDVIGSTFAASGDSNIEWNNIRNNRYNNYNRSNIEEKVESYPHEVIIKKEGFGPQYENLFPLEVISSNGKDQLT